MNGDSLTSSQRALQRLALRQLDGVAETLRRLLTATVEQGDREAVQDAAGSVAASQELLRDWFGKEPGTVMKRAHDHIA